MVVFREFLSLTVAVVTIISPSHCQSVPNTQEIGRNKYQKFMIDEEISTSTNSSIVIRSAPRCGLILAQTVERIISLYMPEKSPLFILTDSGTKNHCFPSAYEELLKLGTINVISMVAGGRNSKPRCVIYQKPNIYLLLGVELSNVLEPLSNFGKMGGTWNPRGLYIGIAGSREEAAELMTSLWKMFVYRVIVLVFQNNTLDTSEAYTWRPYHPLNYCGPPTVENIIRLGKFTEILDFEKETNTEPGMLPKTFGNCPLNISYNIWEPFVYSRAEDQDLAIEAKLIQMICDKIGVKINPYYHPLFIFKEPGESWAGTRIPRAADLKMYEVSTPYIQDNFVWIVPRSEETKLFEIANELPSSLWIPSTLAMIVASISLLASGNQYWILWVWGSFLEQADYKVAKKIRGIWAFWLLLCLHLSVAYKTVLVSRLTDPSIKDKIQDQSDLLESGLKLGFINGAELFFNGDDEIERKIIEQHVTCQTVKKCYKEIPTGIAVFTNKMFANYLDGQKDEMGSIAEKVRQLPTSLTYKVAMIYSKGHAVLPSFDRVLLFGLQAGFVNHWVKEIEETQTRINMRRLNFTKEPKLSFAQVHGGFTFLRTGLVLAGVSFLYEIFSHLLKARFSCYVKRTTSFWNLRTEV